MEVMVDEGEEEDEKHRRVEQKWGGATQVTHVFFLLINIGDGT